MLFYIGSSNPVSDTSALCVSQFLRCTSVRFHSSRRKLARSLFCHCIRLLRRCNEEDTILPKPFKEDSRLPWSIASSARESIWNAGGGRSSVPPLRNVTRKSPPATHKPAANVGSRCSHPPPAPH